MMAALVPTVFAQKGTICGMIQDQTGALVVGAAVDLSNSDTRLDAKTGLAGKFCFNLMKPGEYELTVQANGFRTDRQKISVRSAEPLQFDDLSQRRNRKSASDRGRRIGGCGIAECRSDADWHWADRQSAQRKCERRAQFNPNLGNSRRGGRFERCIPPAWGTRGDFLQC